VTERRPYEKGDRQQQDLEEDLVASDQPILQYPPASLGTLANPSTLNTYLSCLDRRESPDHKCNRAVLLSGCRQTVVNEAPMVISGLVDDLRFTCKSSEKESAPEGTRTPGLRHARAPRRFAGSFWSLQNACK
jgi:hypothetical protein